MGGLSRLLATTNIPLTTSPKAVTAPDGMPKSTGVLVGCVDSSGEWVKWDRQAASGSTYSATCLAGKEGLPIGVSGGKTPFYAKMPLGAGTLQVEWWE